MPDLQTVTIGARAFGLSKLKLGQLRRNEPLRAAVAALQSLSGTLGKAGVLPTAEQFDTMLIIAHASASAADPAVTLEEFSAAIDAEDFDIGFRCLAECVAIATYGSLVQSPRGAGARSTGEADSPSSLTSDGSTGSSQPAPAIALETSTT